MLLRFAAVTEGSSFFVEDRCRLARDREKGTRSVRKWLALSPVRISIDVQSMEAVR